jgi:hypothetical protein
MFVGPFTFDSRRVSRLFDKNFNLIVLKEVLLKQQHSTSLLYPPQRSCYGINGILVSSCPSVCRQILCRTIAWVVFLRIDKISKHSEKHYSSYHTTYGKNPIFRHIKSNNSGTTKVKIVKNERDSPLFTNKLMIKFQNILRNTTPVIIRHRVKILFSVISSPITLERQKWKNRQKWKGSSSLHQ